VSFMKITLASIIYFEIAVEITWINLALALNCLVSQFGVYNLRFLFHSFAGLGHLVRKGVHGLRAFSRPEIASML